MIKTYTNILIGLLLSTGLMAQEYKKDWSEGKLTWQDFSVKENVQGISELKYFFGYKADKQKYGDTTVYRYKAICYMDKDLSWINNAYKEDLYLRYNQVIFDIVEIHRRRLQFELDRVSSFFEIEQKFNRLYTSCNNEIDKFNQESKGGQNVGSVEFWEQKTSEELKIQPDNAIPLFESRNFGYGMHAGIGSGFFTGSLGEHFAPTFNFMFGFDFAYKKSIFYLNATLAGDKVKMDYLSDKSWQKDQRANIAIGDISYGYALIDNEKCKISPFAGLCFVEFSAENKDDTNELRIIDNNLIFGVNIDYKLRTRLKFSPNTMYGFREKLETSIRARLYITKANYYEDLQGYSINLTIGICGFGNLIKIK